MQSIGETTTATQSITNYDVLVNPPNSVMPPTAFSLAKHKDHVGNNRLQVFLNLYQQSYGNAQERNDQEECDKIVDKIVDTVCNKCVPRGRFLVSQNMTVENGMPTIQWHPMDEDSIRQLLHGVLKPIQTAGGNLRGMSSSSSTNEAHSRTSLGWKIDASQGGSASSSFPPQSAANVADGVDDGQKRRRRSSLLRRSASESMVGLVLDNKKKLNRSGNDSSLFGSEEEPASWKSARSAGGHGLTNLNRMDVILTPARDALDPNSQSVGNNRLHILVAMQAGKYQQATVEGRETILDEVLQTVDTFWKGRFLVEGPTGHEQLDRAEARYALQTIFDLRTGQTTIPPIGRYKRHSDPVRIGFNQRMMMARNPAIGSSERVSTAASRSNSNNGNNSNHADQLIRGQTPIHKQASASILPTGSDLPDVLHLRSQAVKSLQKQKARQNIASRLQKLGVTDDSSRTGKGDAVQLFPLGGKIPRSDMVSRKIGSSSTGNMYSSFSSVATTPSVGQRRRESTVLGKLDASVMEQLVAEFDEADCNDETDEPLPPSNSNVFGSRFNDRNRSGNGNNPFSGSSSAGTFSSARGFS